MSEIYPAGEDYANPADMTLSETLILENELAAVHGLLVKIWSVLGQNKELVSRSHSRAAVVADLAELALMADYAAAALRRLSGGPEAARPAEAGRPVLVKLYALSAAPATLNPADASIIYNDKITQLVNGKIVDRVNGEWYAAFYGPRSEGK